MRHLKCIIKDVQKINNGFQIKILLVFILLFSIHQITDGQLYINEIMASPAGEAIDWIEIYNAGNTSVNLSGKYLSDNAGDLTKWQFTTNATIQPTSFLILVADGFGIEDNHTNFKLSSDGGSVILTDIDGITTIHKLVYKNQYYGVSYGLLPDGSETHNYFKTATQGKSNYNPYGGVIDGPFFNLEHGFYENPVQISITTSESDATVFYTIDGSTPSLKEDGSTKKFTTAFTISTTTCVRAVAIKPGWKTSEVKTSTYIFLGDVLKQPARPSGFPTDWGHTGQGDFEMDPDIVNKAPYNSTIIDDMKSIPTLSLVMDRGDWFGSNGRGIYIEGELDERAVSAELILPNGDKGFQVNCGVMVFGGSSVNRWKTDKLSLKLKFKSVYETATLKYPLFGEDMVSEFNTVALDARLNQCWAYGGTVSAEEQRLKAQYTRDQFACDIQNNMGGIAPNGRHVHLYINGLYWGLYSVHERPDEHFASAHLGGFPEHYDVLKHNKNSVVNGSNETYFEMFNIADNPLSDADQFRKISNYLDIESFVDYILVNFYLGNNDWAHQNWYASHNSISGDGKWRYHSWDAEHIMEELNTNSTNKDDDGGPTHLHQQLMKNSIYRDIFMNRVQKHFYGDGVFMPENIRELYQIRLNEVDRAVVGESARWGDNQRNVPYTRDEEWVAQRDYLLNTYFAQRRDIVLDQFMNNGWLSDLSAPYFEIDIANVFGGEVPFGSELEIEAEKGQIYYTLNGEDPWMYKTGDNGQTASEGQINPNAMVYSEPISIEDFYTIKARAYENNKWSALSEIILFTKTDLIISELNYHPQENEFADEDQLEFIELKNIGDKSINLEDMTFVEGVSYSFPQGTTINPDEFLVLASDKTSFTDFYGFMPFDEYTGSLDNSGERVLITGKNNETVYDFRYDDKWPWPIGADGKGKTMVPVNPETKENYQNYAYWRSSAFDKGSPGKDDPKVTTIISENVDVYNNIRVEQNYPNPFTDYTFISYSIPDKSMVRIEIFSLFGQKLSTLTNEMQPAGQYTVKWGGVEQNGQPLLNGIYFCRITINDYSKILGMTLNR